MLADEQRRVEMGAAAREVAVERYSWPTWRAGWRRSTSGSRSPRARW
jgi:hypothetical protein